MTDPYDDPARPGPDSPYYVPPPSTHHLYAVLAVRLAGTLALVVALGVAIVKRAWVSALFIALLLGGLLWLRSKTVLPMLRELRRRRLAETREGSRRQT